MPPATDLVLAGAAAFVAGGINAVAGGGTLVSFPTLVGLGVPSVSANVTNTVALSPGYLGGAIAQRRAVAQHRERLRALLPVTLVGALGGAVLLVVTSESLFRAIVPYLILGACALLGFQDGIKRLVFNGRERDHHGAVPPALYVAVFVAAVYGAYFGAGLGIMLLAVLGLLLDDDLNTLNALKSVLSLAINLLAACFFVFSAKVAWGFVAVMAPASLVGGHVGGLLAGRLNPKVLRAVVIAFGVAVALKMLFL